MSGYNLSGGANVRGAARTPLSLDDLNTPCLLLDPFVMQANIMRMADRCATLGVRLRPHVKTPKSIPIARALIEAGACGLTVSTLNEAEYLAAAGFKDIFYAVPVTASKVARAAAMIRQGCNLSLLVDHPIATDGIVRRAQEEAVVLPIWVEIDVDHYRTGVAMDSAAFEAIIDCIRSSEWADLAGIMSYGGASYGCTDPASVASLAERHRQALLDAARKVVAAGMPRPRLSFGSTPAVRDATTMEGIDEVRCGIYVFQDLFQAGIGACAHSDIAVSVLATVIGHQPQTGRLTIDAGALALSKDRSTQGKPFDAGFGLVADAQTGAVIDNLYVSIVSQELGIVTTRNGTPMDYARFPIDSRVRILPNHADMTAAAYEQYCLVSSGGAVVDVWHRTNGW